LNVLLYAQLIGYTAGTLVTLFWMVVILGYRRRRNFERVFFFLCLALFLFYSGSLLGLNAKIHYVSPPAALRALSDVLVAVGLLAFPPLLIHLHLEYANARALLHRRLTKRLVLAAAYVPILYFVFYGYSLLMAQSGFEPSSPSELLGRAFGVWLVLALSVGLYWQRKFSKAASDRREAWFHKVLFTYFVPISVICIYLYLVQGPSAARAGITTTLLALLAIFPFAFLLEMVFRFNFLNIGNQRNLLYAVSVTFIALLYLSLVRRIALWLQHILPPEATAAVLLFVLVIFIEPLQRILAQRLREAARREMSRVQKLMAEIQREARNGDGKRLRAFIEQQVREQLSLREALLHLEGEEGSEDEASQFAGGTKREPSAAIPFDPRDFPLQQSGQDIGLLHVEPHGAAVSGETRAALEFLCEQLPGALDLCRLIEEKVRLERELAERERLAALGQMAASISHNLKNPLGSIKTILQVQLESSELPESLRSETQLVLEEISRLSAKLNQLLQFSRPAMDGAKGTGGCDAVVVANDIVEVLRHEAEHKGVTLGFVQNREGIRVQAAKEAVNDILSNLVVNAIDAAPQGGQVKLEVAQKDGKCVLSIEDDGPGIPVELQEKVLEPFFTTKAHGTGLGLAIVARRASEAGGRVELVSPTRNARGSRFLVWLPLGEEKQ
jgi:signal transduction histidine kinase